MPSDAAKLEVAQSNSEAQVAAADPAKPAEEVQPMVGKAANSQADADKLRTNRAIVFWAIASICGLVISGWFGLFLLQSIATGPVNSFLDLAVTGLTIGAGPSPRTISSPVLRLKRRVPPVLDQGAFDGRRRSCAASGYPGPAG